MADSKQDSKKARGGKRAGAGRKPSTISGVVKKLPSDTAILILAEINANQKWVKLSKSRDERIQLEVLKYLTDRAHGKPKQAVEMQGGLSVDINERKQRLNSILGQITQQVSQQA